MERFTSTLSTFHLVRPGFTHTNTNQRLAYNFTGKELDESTGLYYFGARYFDARANIWASPDPILDKYLPDEIEERNAKLAGMGGIYRPVNLGMYAYAHNNPVKLTDPDGNATAAAGCAGGVGVWFGGVGAGPGCAIGAGVTTVATLLVGAIALTLSGDTPQGQHQNRATEVHSGGGAEHRFSSSNCSSYGKW